MRALLTARSEVERARYTAARVGDSLRRLPPNLQVEIHRAPSVRSALMRFHPTILILWRGGVWCEDVSKSPLRERRRR